MEPDLPNYYIIDILPKQVPASSTGQYFKIERYFLNGPQFEEIIKKFSSLLIKLNCYFDLTVYCGKVVSDTNPSPEDICHFLKESVRNHKPVLFYMNKDKGQFHIDFSGDDHYMGLVLPYLYPGLLGLIKQLATAEGLFVWPRQFVDQNE